jgi:cation diffusion facilitator family transporter
MLVTVVENSILLKSQAYVVSSAMNEATTAHTPGHARSTTLASLVTSRRGIWAVKWSLVGLALTALLQAIVVYYSGSVALLADTIHNAGDALTAIPLWIAFRVSTWRPNARFPYGYGRVEDLAGIVVVLTILFSAALSGYESINRFFHPQEIRFVGAVMAASLIGFVGNEAVAQFRIRVGREIGSAALVADGHHARIDGLTSLAVLVGALGVYAGYPLADPVIGILITVAILRVVWEAGAQVLTRIVDGVDPSISEEIKGWAMHIPSVREVSEVRVRWIGHRIRAEVNIAVEPGLTVEAGHAIAKEVRHHLLEHLTYLDDVLVHVDPLGASGEEYHYVRGHDD